MHIHRHRQPAGLVVHPAPATPDGNFVNALIAHCARALLIVGCADQDRPPSRWTPAGSSWSPRPNFTLRAGMTSLHGISRAYAAVVWGVPMPASGEIAGNIGRSVTNRKKMAVVADARGKPALTRYRVERAFGDTAALIECRLLTGRTHQIRVHLAHRGHPLIGDPVYGGRAGRAVFRGIGAFLRQALHARHLGFTHPATGAALSFDSKLPDDMTELLSNLERL